MPHLLVLARELCAFSVGYYSKSKECLRIVRVLPGPLQQYTLKDNRIRINNRKIFPIYILIDDRISQKVLEEEKLVLKQATFLLDNHWYKVQGETDP